MEERFSSVNEQNKKSNKNHKCSYVGCNKSFIKPCLLARHIRTHTGERPYKCPNCDQAFGTSSHLKRHLYLIHDLTSVNIKPVVNSGKRNPTTLPDEDVILDNEQEKQLNKKHKCSYEDCNKSFNKPSRLVWHLRTHTGEKPYKCTYENCDRAYRTSSHLKRHLSTHDVVESYVQCHVCKLMLKNRMNLSKHYRRVHENENKLHCQICGVTFRKKIIFEDHKRFHNREIFDCDKCDKSFESLLKFRRHQKNHTIKYYCEISNCDGQFENITLYRKHCKTHKDPNEEREKKLRLRLSAHDREKNTILIPCPYDQCHRVYYYQSNLTHHIRTKHEGVNKYECDLCKIKFKTKRPLIYHFKSCHHDSFGEVNENSENATNDLIKNKRKKQKKRCDAGLPKKSMISKLIGISLPNSMEQTLLRRDTDKTLFDNNFIDL